jgi:hypothetical protein
LQLDIEKNNTRGQCFTQFDGCIYSMRLAGNLDIRMLAQEGSQFCTSKPFIIYDNCPKPFIHLRVQLLQSSMFTRIQPASSVMLK